jgi:hypothetical protein
MTLNCLRENLSAEDREEWEIYARKMTIEHLRMHLSINSDMEEFEICEILQKEIESRKTASARLTH